MKQIFFIFTLLIFFYSTLLSQNELNGIYHSESGHYLKIRDSRFQLILPNNAMNGFFSEVLAEGVIKYINNSFIELNSSNSPTSKALESLEVNQSNQQVSDDSIKIIFSIPNKRENLKITVYTNNFKTFKFFYSDSSKEILIPKGIRSFSFTVEPEDPKDHTFDGLFYGILSLNSLEYDINRCTNLIEISIPALDGSFFETYYIKGDYAQLIDESIIWKGEVYKKIK